METFFHLSESRNGMAIVCSFDKRASETDKYFSPRTPRSHAGEPKDMRICVAPTVRQCLCALPIRLNFEGALSIYKLQCFGAIEAETGVVKDAKFSSEHWITDDVIAANRGEISLSLYGVIPEPKLMQLRLYPWTAGKVIRTSDYEFEAWEIKREYSIPKWGVRIHPSFRATDQEPLERPKWD
jgi:hypothetical protein